MKLSNETDKIFKSLYELRKVLKQPTKDGDNPFFKSKYVVLEGVIKSFDEAVKELSEENGLFFSQEVTGNAEDNTVSVATSLFHVSGQYIIYDPVLLPVKGKQDNQAYGASITYARRYGLSAVLGISSDIDDDGNSASANENVEQNKQPNYNSNSTKKANENQVKMIKARISSYAKKHKMEQEKILNNVLGNFDAERLEDLNYKQVNEVVKSLE